MGLTTFLLYCFSRCLPHVSFAEHGNAAALERASNEGDQSPEDLQERVDQLVCLGIMVWGSQDHLSTSTTRHETPFAIISSPSFLCSPQAHMHGRTTSTCS